MGFLKGLFGRKKQETVYLTADEMTGISGHFEKHFGPVSDATFHELVSDRVHIDVYTIPDVSGRGFGVAFTTGMSALPMPGMPPERAYAELFVLLPSDWPMDEKLMEGMETYWPAGFLKMMARLPTSYRTAVTPGISMPNGDPAEEFPGTRFCGMMVGRPDMVDPAFAQAELNGKVINF